MKLRHWIATVPLCFLTVPTAASQCDNYLQQFDPSQINVIETAYTAGLPTDMGLTLAALVIRESSAGKYLVNWKDPSFGPYHILLKTGMSRLKMTGIKNELWLATTLVSNHGFSASMAVMELQYWQGRHKGNWYKTWASYNAGHKWTNGIDYADKIRYSVAQLQQCKLEGKLG